MTFIHNLEAAAKFMSEAANLLVVPANVVMSVVHLEYITNVMETLHDDRATLLTVISEMKPPLTNLTKMQVLQALESGGEHSKENDSGILNAMYVMPLEDHAGTYVYCIAYEGEESGHLEYASVYVRWDGEKGQLVANY